MLVLRAYPVMGRLTVEISCVHGGDPTASHLVYRSLSWGTPEDLEEALNTISEQLAYVCTLVREGAVLEYDDCTL